MLSRIKSLFSSDQISGDRDFVELSIVERVLDTGERVIAIDNVATVSIGTARYKLWRILAWIVFAILMLKFVMSIFGAVALSDVPELMWGVAIVALYYLAGAGIVYLIIRFWLQDVTYLSIGASDGSHTSFKSKDAPFLREVKDFLAKKINERDANAKLVADFAKNAKQPITINGNVHLSQHHGHVVNGSNNVIDSAGAAVGEGAVGGGNTFGKFAGALQIGGSGNRQSASVQRVDYSHVLPTVEQWRQHYAGDPDAKHLSDRLTELERLMKAGTPSKEEKSRARTIAGEISGILQGYPPAVQLAADIARLVGVM